MRRILLGFVFPLVLVPSLAAAQQPQPLPPPSPPPPGQYPPGQYQQPPPAQYQPPPGQYPGYGQQQPQYYPPPQQPQYYPPPEAPHPRPAPPPVEYVEPPVPTHAPKFSLWVGPRLSYMGFGLGFYKQRYSDQVETTGNFIGNGVAGQLDVGARLAKKYVPHVFWEHGFMGQGHRFTGSDATSSTDYYGIGFRFGGADDVGFISDISVGQRIVRVSQGGDTYTMSGLEIFKLGLGAEFRLDTLFTLEFMGTVALGSMNDSTGTVKYSAEGSKDGLKEPDYRNGDVISNSTTYVNLTLGVGVHFDVFGK